MSNQAHGLETVTVHRFTRVLVLVLTEHCPTFTSQLLPLAQFVCLDNDGSVTFS